MAGYVTAHIDCHGQPGYMGGMNFDIDSQGGGHAAEALGPDI